MSLKSQRRLAAELLKIGANRVWIDPENRDRVEAAITRDEIRRLIHERIIKKVPERGVSKGRRIEKRRRGRGSRKGRTTDPKQLWINKVRKMRERLKDLREGKRITSQTYRRLYLMAKGGAFKSISHLDEYMESHKLIKKR